MFVFGEVREDLFLRNLAAKSKEVRKSVPASTYDRVRSIKVKVCTCYLLLLLEISLVASSTPPRARQSS